MSNQLDVKFADRSIGLSSPVLIIAEIGVNHEGNIDTCARMIEAAANAGADAIKLQTMDADENYVPGTESHTLFKQAWLEHDETAAMFELARHLGVVPFTTLGDLKTFNAIQDLQPAAYKISSGLLTHLPLIRHIAKTGATLLMSTGMNDMQAVDEAVATAREGGTDEIALFQCTSLYPTPPEVLNIAAIGEMSRRFGVPCGLSDHSIGTEAAALSVAAGGCMIEKHFTLDNSRPSFDHHLSLEPDGFLEMVRRVRAAEVMVGRQNEDMNTGVQETARRFHRCVVARRDIVAGATIAADDLAVMRVMPGQQGLHPREYDRVIGSVVRRSIAKFEAVHDDDLGSEGDTQE
jgi:sialic acid synthase SpsE